MYGVPDVNTQSGFIRGIVSSILAIAVGFGVLHESNASIDSPFSVLVVLSVLLGAVIGVLFAYSEMNDTVRSKLNELAIQIVLAAIVSTVVITVLVTSLSGTYPALMLIGLGTTKTITLLIHVLT